MLVIFSVQSRQNVRDFTRTLDIQRSLHRKSETLDRCVRKEKHVFPVSLSFLSALSLECFATFFKHSIIPFINHINGIRCDANISSGFLQVGILCSTSLANMTDSQITHIVIFFLFSTDLTLFSVILIARFF